MPLVKLEKNAHYSYSIWRIDEPERFFSESLGFASERNTEKRRLEFLASRYLLKYLLPEFPFGAVTTPPQGKPVTENDIVHFSISHSFPYVAVVIGRFAVGIDIQVYREKIHRVKHKFLSAKEQQIVGNTTPALTLAWTVKESVFKWYGKGSIDLIGHIRLRTLSLRENAAAMEVDFLKTEETARIKLQGGVERDYAWSVMTGTTE